MALVCVFGTPSNNDMPLRFAGNVDRRDLPGTVNRRQRQSRENDRLVGMRLSGLVETGELATREDQTCPWSRPDIRGRPQNVRTPPWLLGVISGPDSQASAGTARVP